MNSAYVVQKMNDNGTWTTTNMKTNSKVLAFALIGKVWKGLAATERYRLVVESTNAHVPVPDIGTFVAWAWLRGYRLSVIENSIAYIKAISTFEPFTVPLSFREAA